MKSTTVEIQFANLPVSLPSPRNHSGQQSSRISPEHSATIAVRRVSLFLGTLSIGMQRSQHKAILQRQLAVLARPHGDDDCTLTTPGYRKWKARWRLYGALHSSTRLPFYSTDFENQPTCLGDQFSRTRIHSLSLKECCLLFLG